jgi:hypothetical protein
MTSVGNETGGWHQTPVLVGTDVTSWLKALIGLIEY